MSKIRLEEIAKQRIESFAKLGKAHLYLAYHAAFPLALTPDLLYRLWVQFQRDIDDQVLGIPWVAVADLLVSSLCNEVGYELYEMDLTVRNLLLSRLQEDKKFGQQRINELSNFLLDYVRPKLESKDPDIQDFALTQQWTALAYTQPNKVAHELALEFDKLDFNNEAELIRIVSLTETFAQPLAEFDPLLSYARGMGKLARGNLEAATDQISKILEGENKIRVAGVDLPIPEKIKANLPELFEQLTNHKNALKRSRFSSLFFLSILALGMLIGGTGIYIFRFHTSQLPQNSLCPKDTYSLNDRISLGEEILLKQDTNSDKEAGVQAFLESNCQLAIDKLSLYRKANSTDPEALIYLNNAKARQKGDRLKIAVSVPIGTNQNVAKEMLRGVAQAQDEVNSSGGINGKALEVVIANDDNNSTQAQYIAKQLLQDKSILAVVGHNASDAAVPAAYEYRDKLVMISPTSFDQRLSNLSNYIFRTISTNDLAKFLSNYINNTTAKTNIVICFDANSLDSNSFRNEFTKAIEESKTTKINLTSCNLSDSNFDPNRMISQAITSGADSLFLAPDVQRIDKALEVVKANQGRLSLFSSPTMYTQQTLAGRKADVNGMVLAIPWHPQAIPGNSFPHLAQKLWGGPVNWRTATTYDATKAIIAGLQQSNTREELQKTLHSPGFSVDGATGKIQFSQSGDRINNSIFLVKVQQIPGTDNYEFVPIQP